MCLIKRHNLFSKLYASVHHYEPTIQKRQNFQKSCEIRCGRNNEIEIGLKNHKLSVVFAA